VLSKEHINKQPAKGSHSVWVFGLRISIYIDGTVCFISGRSGSLEKSPNHLKSKGIPKS